MLTDDITTPASDPILRDRAVQRLKKKRDFHAHLLVFLLVNLSIVIVWALTDSHGFFWPLFPIVFWGIGVVMNGYDVYRREDFTETSIRREMAKLK
jgi:hypothetical protein